MSKKRINPSVCEGVLVLQEITYLRESSVKKALFYLLSVLSLGIFYIIAIKNIELLRFMKYSIVNEIGFATHFFVRNWDDVGVILAKADIQTYNFDTNKRAIKVGFRNRGLAYVYSTEDKTFSALEYPVYRPFKEIRERLAGGNREEDIANIRSAFGRCELNFEIPSFFKLFFNEISQPFFVFQLFAVVVWFVTAYYYFGGFILLVSILSGVVNLRTVKTNLMKIHDLVHYKAKVDLFRMERGRYSKLTDVSSTEIVPGDLLVIKDRFRLPCDCLLLTGQALVDECALTGESIPVSKFSLPTSTDKYIASLHKAYTLYEGTVVVQRLGNTQNDFLALVIRTNFSTMKGQLVRGILYPKQLRLRFDRDSYVLIAVLIVVLLIGFGCIVPTLSKSKTAWEMIKTLLELSTSAIPASLPAALTVSMMFSLIRYRNEKINCISPHRIISAGRVDTVCFDKTGTLTYEDMNIRGYKVASNGVFKEFILPNFDKASYATSEDKISVFRALAIMGTCHNVVIFTQDGAFRMIGDPMEVKMIEFSSYYYKQEKKPGVMYTMHNPVRDVDYQVLRRFEFLSEVGRMSVICATGNQKTKRVYLKGAPEIVKTLCNPKTIPKNYDERLSDFTVLGYRVLALAWRDLTKLEEKKKLHEHERELIESDLNFVGFLIFENMLKLESRPVIAALNRANVDSKIVTGDNPVTAVHVGREISILSNNTEVYVCDLVENDSEFYLQFKKLKGRDSMLMSAFKGEDDEGFNTSRSMMTSRSGATSRRSLNGSQATSRSTLTQKKQVETLDSENVLGGDMIKITRYIHDEKLDNDACEYVMSKIPKGPNIQHAFTGKAFDFLLRNSTLYDEELSHWRVRAILLRSKIYSRMQPNHKSSLIDMLKEHGKTVGMVGDGANDCGALQTADIGLSLSQTEASISAPLTSNDGSILSLIDVLAEGRCVLSTNIIIFKYMTCYGILQYAMRLILAERFYTLNNIQRIWQDLAVVVPIITSMSWTGPYEELEDDLPAGSIFTLRCILSMLGVCGIQTGGQFAILNFMNSTFKDGVPEDVMSAVLFTFSLFLFLGIFFSYNVSKPFREPITNNMYLSAILVFHVIMIGVIGATPAVRQYVFLMPAPNVLTSNFVAMTIGISAAFAVGIFVYEVFFVNVFVKFVEKLLEERKQANETKKLYGMVERDQSSTKASFELPTVSA